MTPRASSLRRAVKALALVLGLSTAGAAAGQTSFYEAAADQLAGHPGTLIRVQPMEAAPSGARAYRILYRSRGLRNEPVAVSGVVFLPTSGAVPKAGRPIVAWAHPTTGVVAKCAPSLARVLDGSIKGLADMLARGFIVTATDYLGLGTPGIHPYLIGRSEGRSVLDSVRAARQLAGDEAGRSFAVWGHSQGGHAALFTGILAGAYAPELRLVGVAAAAPATELAALMKADFDTAGGKNLTAITLWSWSRLFRIPLTPIVRRDALPVMDELANGCIETIWDVLARRIPSRRLQESFLSVDGIADREPWRSLLRANTPGTLPRNLPVFIAEGLADDLVLPSVTLDYRGRLCRAGSRVELHLMPGVGHAFAAERSAASAVTWMANRFAGVPPPDNCRGGS